MSQPDMRLAGRTALFDGMAWPIADQDVNWRLRYAPESITRADQLYLASVVSAYAELYSITNDRRRHAVKRLRLAAHRFAARRPSSERGGE